MTRSEAITLALAEIRNGYAIRYLSDTSGVHVESNQGWSTLWSDADEPRPAGADDSLTD